MMITVPQVIAYYQQFFENMILEIVRHDDNLITEWKYFTSLLSNAPQDLNRIQTYLGILSLKKKNPLQAKEPNVDTDYDEFDSGSEEQEQNDPSSKRRKNCYEEEEEENENAQDVMIIEKRQDFEEIQRKGQPTTPDNKGYFNNFSSGKRSHLTQDNPSPILKEITSNFNNIKSSAGVSNSRKQVRKPSINSSYNFNSGQNNGNANSISLGVANNKVPYEGEEVLKSQNGRHNRQIKEEVEEKQVSKPQWNQENIPKITLISNSKNLGYPSRVNLKDQELLSILGNQATTPINQNANNLSGNTQHNQFNASSNSKHVYSNSTSSTTTNHNNHNPILPLKNLQEISSLTRSTRTLKNDKLALSSKEQTPLGEKRKYDSASIGKSTNEKNQTNFKSSDYQSREQQFQDVNQLLEETTPKTAHSEPKNQIKILYKAPLKDINPQPYTLQKLNQAWHQQVSHKIESQQQNQLFQLHKQGDDFKLKNSNQNGEKNQSPQLFLNQTSSNRQSLKQNPSPLQSAPSSSLPQTQIPQYTLQHFSNDSNGIQQQANASTNISQQQPSKKEFQPFNISKIIGEILSLFEVNSKKIDDIIISNQQQSPSIKQQLITAATSPSSQTSFTHTNRYQPLFHQPKSQQSISTTPTYASSLNQYSNSIPSFSKQLSIHGPPSPLPQALNQYKIMTSPVMAHQIMNDQQITQNYGGYIRMSSSSSAQIKNIYNIQSQQQGNGEKTFSHGSRENNPLDGENRSLLKRMKTYDTYSTNSASYSIRGAQKILNKTTDENLNSSKSGNNNSLSRIALESSKYNPLITQHTNGTVQNNNNNNASFHETNRVLTNSTNQLFPSDQAAPTRKRGDYSFPDLKSFNKFIKRS